VLITQPERATFSLRHREDAGRTDLVVFRGAEEAAEIAKYDDAGLYRPLKTAPNLRHGWCLALPDLSAVLRALDLLYPARLAAWFVHEERRLVVTPLRETLGRQTGMYRAASRITEEQADGLVASFCRSDGGCLRTILWRRDAAGTPASSLLPTAKFDPAHDQIGAEEAVIPLLCQEACNLLVAEARKVVKGERSDW
jgi:sirohydrochlorin cobaltochelatase